MRMSLTPMGVDGILGKLKELDRIREDLEDIVLEINKMHKKLQTTPEVVEKPGDNSLSRLKMLYIEAKDLSESEVFVSGQLIDHLDALMTSQPPGRQRRRTEGKEQKNKRRKADPHNDLENLKGEQVAARVTLEGATKDEWFIVKVLHFDRETREFEVIDEEPGDEEESAAQRKYKLPISHILPFPKRNYAQDFPLGKQVLAVYPGTTALYKATVVSTRKRKNDDYILEFDDDEEDGRLPQRHVPFDKVVPLPKGHCQ